MADHRSALEPLLVGDEAAAVLRVSPKALYLLVEQKRVPHVRIGRSIRFRAADLAAWLDGCARGAS